LQPLPSEARSKKQEAIRSPWILQVRRIKHSPFFIRPSAAKKNKKKKSLTSCEAITASVLEDRNSFARMEIETISLKEFDNTQKHLAISTCFAIACLVEAMGC